MVTVEKNNGQRWKNCRRYDTNEFAGEEFFGFQGMGYSRGYWFFWNVRLLRSRLTGLARG